MDDQWVVVVFGDKRRHSDVVGPFDDQAAAESFAEEERLNSGQDCYAFCLVNKSQYMADNYGDDGEVTDGE